MGLCGTVADISLGVLMSFVAPILELLNFLYKSLVGHVLRSDTHTEIAAKLLQTLLVVILFPFIYLIYSCILLIDVIRDNFYPFPQPNYPTVHKKESVFALHYKKDPRYKNGNKEVENSKFLARYLSIKIVKVIREKAEKDDKFIAPVVQISMGPYANISGTPVSMSIEDDHDTGEPIQIWTYSDPNMNFLLSDSFSDSAGESINITILDKSRHDIYTGSTETFDELSNFLVDSWICSNRFEGKLKLKGGTILQIAAAVMSHESEFTNSKISPTINFINDDRNNRARNIFERYFEERYYVDANRVTAQNSQKFLYAPIITFDENERSLIFRDIDNYRSIDHQQVLFTKLHERFGELGENMVQHFEKLPKEIMDLIQAGLSSNQRVV